MNHVKVYLIYLTLVPNMVCEGKSEEDTILHQFPNSALNQHYLPLIQQYLFEFISLMCFYISCCLKQERLYSFGIFIFQLFFCSQ